MGMQVLETIRTMAQQLAPVVRGERPAATECLLAYLSDNKSAPHPPACRCKHGACSRVRTPAAASASLLASSQASSGSLSTALGQTTLVP